MEHSYWQAGHDVLTTQPQPRYHMGDLVTTRADAYPQLYEILRVEVDGLLRVRCLNWAPGFSALISAAAVRPISRILA